MFDLNHYDPPSYAGTPQQEAHAEMIQIFGMENPEKEYILTDYDVWEKNPFYHGPAGRHPEDDYYDESEFVPLIEQVSAPVLSEDDDDIPF